MMIAKRRLRGAAVASAALFVVLVGRHAHAQRDKAAAEVLFQEGRTLINAGNIKAGCDKLAASQHLDPAIGTALNLGDCLEKQGKTASSWAYFREAADMARASDDLLREAEARKRAARLEPRLGRLQINPGSTQQPGLVVMRDGERINPAILGVAVPIDPGVHKIEASAPGRLKWSKQVEVKGDGDVVAVAVPALHVRSTGAQPEPAPDDRPSLSSQRTAALVAGGIGLVALGVGGYFGVRAIRTWNDAGSRCPGSVCSDSSDLKLEEDARQQAKVSTVMFAVGGVSLGMAALLWATSSSNSPSSDVSKTMNVRVSALPSQGASIVWEGRY